jgi:hypothetical protein
VRCQSSAASERLVTYQRSTGHALSDNRLPVSSRLSMASSTGSFIGAWALLTCLSCLSVLRTGRRQLRPELLDARVNHRSPVHKDWSVLSIRKRWADTSLAV